MHQSEQKLEFALRAGRLGSWEFDIARQRFTSSAHSRVIFGLGPDDPFDTLEDVIALVHPDDRERRRLAILRAIDTGEELEVEYRITKKDGSIGWILARGLATYENGQAVRLTGISLDITERKAAEAHQKLLLDELNHRVKNTLAIVQSIALQTARHSAGPEDFNRALIARIDALASAHDLLTEASWQSASLGEVIRRTLAPRATGSGAGWAVREGPALRLAPNAAVTLNLVFHELASNSVRYGALSSPDGRVEVVWAVEAPGVVVIDWRETGGPPVLVPTRRGFGSRLIEEGLPREMGGEATLTFAPSGLTCQIRTPLSAKVMLAA